MKLSLIHKVKQLGSSLITTLVICSILSMFVMYYLSLIDQQSYLSARSQVWNMAIAASEAGVEDGLQQLNNAFPYLSSDGWSYDGVTTYTRSNSLPDGSGYLAYIFVTNSLYPVVMARAYVQSLPRYGMASPLSFFAAGNLPNQTTAPTTVTRTVLVNTKKRSPFQVAMVAKNNIDLNGNGITTDSYDSGDPSKSVNGQYSSSYYTGDRGDVATDLGVIDSLSSGNAKIYGHAHTGPGSPANAVQIGPNGVIGTHSWAAANTGIETGYWMPDSNFTFPDTTFPSTAGYMTPTNGTITTSSNYLTLGSPVTVNYPSAPPAGGASTNVVSSTTVSTYPNPPPSSVTTNVGSATVSSYPSGPPPAGLTTNTVMVNNSPTLPGIVPTGTTTNNVLVNNSPTLPLPPPLGTVTNTTPTTSKTYPTAGTYLGVVVTTIVLSGPQSGRGTWYTYNLITGYTYSYQTYNYPTYTYTYPTYSYTYPSAFSYTPYVTNTVYLTNSYNQILWGTTSDRTTNYYTLSSLSGSTLVLGENVVLALPSGLSMSGQDSITLASGQNVIAWSGTTPLTQSYPQANINVFVGGTSCTVGGNGVMNQPGYPADFVLWAAPTVTTVSFSGNGQFSGCIVAPSAAVTMNGGGSGNEDYCGALIANTITMNGHFNFHYDEALDSARKLGRFIITSWNEVK